MSGIASVSCSAVVAAAVTNLLPWVAYSVLRASSTTATAVIEAQQPARRVSRARVVSQATFRDARPLPVADGKVDVSLDLAGPDSAAAWTTIKQVVWDYGFRTEFVFHILPTSRNPVVFDAAKAVQVVRMNAADGHEVALFIDAMLDHQSLITMLDNEADDADDDEARLEFFEEVLVKGAVVGGSVTEDQFRRGMQDPQVDHLVKNELEAAALLGVYATPTVLLNGIHTMSLVGEQQLRNFELFVGRGMAPQPLYDIGVERVRA